MLFYIFIAVVIVALSYAIIKAATANPYGKMTDEDFEKRAQHATRLGGAMAELQKVFDPSHKAELVIEAQEEEQSASPDSGDPPEPGSSGLSKIPPEH